MTEQNHTRRKGNKRMTGAVLISAVLHCLIVCGVGALLVMERPEVLRFDVDLRLLAAPAPKPPESISPAPQIKPPSRRKPVARIRPTQLPVPKPAVKPVPENEPKPEPEQQTVARAPILEHEETAPAGPSLSTEPKPIPRDALAQYQRIIYQKINRSKRYPRQSIMNEDEGTPKVRFVITGSGSVSEIKVVRSSGHSLLDQAAVEAVRRAAPFPPPPGGRGGALTVPIRFELR